MLFCLGKLKGSCMPGLMVSELEVSGVTSAFGPSGSSSSVVDDEAKEEGRARVGVDAAGANGVAAAFRGVVSPSRDGQNVDPGDQRSEN